MNLDDEIGGMESEPLTGAIIGACIEVHRLLGPGLNESIYSNALCQELELRGVAYRRQVEVAVMYKGKSIGKGFIDLLVEGQVVVELKACEAITSRPPRAAGLLSEIKQHKNRPIDQFQRPRLKRRNPAHHEPHQQIPLTLFSDLPPRLRVSRCI
jgi:GxxExxY protein